MYQIKLMRLNEGEVLIEEITSEDLGGRMIIDFFERLPNVFLPVCGVEQGHAKHDHVLIQAESLF